MKIFPQSNAPLGIQLIGLFHILFPAGLIILIMIIDFWDRLINGPGSLFGMEFRGVFALLGLFILPFTLPFIYLGFKIPYSYGKNYWKLISLILMSIYLSNGIIIFLGNMMSGYDLKEIIMPLIISLLFSIINFLFIIYLLFNTQVEKYYQKI